MLASGLTTQASIRLESSAQLAADVAAIARVSSRRVQPVPEFEDLLSFELIPFALLAELGRATSPWGVESSGHPYAAALTMSSQWAILKYLWAFDLPRPWEGRQRFTPLVREVHRHARGVMSEDMGIGVALTLARSLVAFGVPRVLDVDWLYANREVLPLVGELAVVRPDYVLVNEPARELVVVEAKGCRSARAQAVKQLAHAVDQVRAFPDCAGYSVRRVAVATVATNSTMSIFAIEVPRQDPSERLREIRERSAQNLLKRSRERSPIDEVFESRARTPLAEVPAEVDTETMDAALTDGLRDSLLTLAGLGEERSRDSYAPEAAQLWDEVRADELWMPEPERQQLDERGYMGRSVEVAVGGRAYRAFTGVDLLQVDLALSAPRELLRVASLAPTDSPSRAGNASGTAWDVAPDGTLAYVEER